MFSLYSFQQNRHLVLRLAGGATLGFAFVAAVRFWLGDLPVLAVLLAGVVVAVRTVANLPFSLLLGLNQAGRWETGELVQRVLGLGLVLFGFSEFGMTGACAGLLGAELGVLAVGLAWTHGYFHWRELRPDLDYLRPFLQFGAAFFGTNLLIILFQHSGAAVVRGFSGGYEEAGYYNLAFQLYLAATQSLWRLMCTMGPLLARLQGEGKLEELRQWTERILSALGVVSVLGCAAMAVLGAPLIRAIAGPGYEPAGALLPWLALSVLAFILGGVARLLAMACGQPSASVGSAIAAGSGLCGGLPFVGTRIRGARRLPGRLRGRIWGHGLAAASGPLARLGRPVAARACARRTHRASVVCCGGTKRCHVARHVIAACPSSRCSHRRPLRAQAVIGSSNRSVGW